MQINVHYHAVLREQFGTAHETIAVPAHATVNDLMRVISEKHSVLAQFRASIQVALNEEIVKTDVGLKEGDNVDLLPPFGGG